MLLLPLYENISIPGDKINEEYINDIKLYIHILWIQCMAKIWNKVDEYITYKYGINCRINKKEIGNERRFIN